MIGMATMPPMAAPELKMPLGEGPLPGREPLGVALRRAGPVAGLGDTEDGTEKGEAGQAGRQGVGRRSQRPDADGKDKPQPGSDPVEDPAEDRLPEGVGEDKDDRDEGVDFFPLVGVFVRIEILRNVRPQHA